jgi:hypothetical protein
VNVVLAGLKVRVEMCLWKENRSGSRNVTFDGEVNDQFLSRI